MAASLFRDDAPWLYELVMEVYRAVKSGDSTAIEAELARLERFSDFTARGPLMDELVFRDKESYLLMREFPRMLHHMLSRTLEPKKPQPRRRQLPLQPEQP